MKEKDCSRPVLVVYFIFRKIKLLFRAKQKLFIYIGVFEFNFICNKKMLFSTRAKQKLFTWEYLS